MRKLSRETKNISIHNSPITPSRSKTNLTAKHLYFCHYNNAMYMGQTKNFQKQGLGMIIHDDGTTLLSSYHLDMLHGYNVAIFKDGSTASLKYHKDLIVEAMFKTNDHILFAKYKKGSPDGAAILLKIKQQQILYLNYKMGEIVNKCLQQDSVILNRVFLQKNYSIVFPRQHFLNIEFSGQYHDEIFVSRRVGKVIIGFSKDQLLLNGLGIIIIQKNPLICSAENEVLERGYYKNSQLSGFGHRNFKNGNCYAGEFKFDQFEGTGVLKNVHKNNWVCGNFQKGTLVELLTYGNNENDRNCVKTLECIHQKKTSWVNRDIVVPMLVFFTKQIEIIGRHRNADMSRVIESRKSQVLKKIQFNFMHEGEQLKTTQRDHYSKMQQLYKNVEGRHTDRSKTDNQDLMKRSIYNNLSTSQKQSRRRNKIFQFSPNKSQNNNPDTFQDPQHSFGLHTPLQNSKQTQSRIELISTPSKEVRFSQKQSVQTPPKKSKIHQPILTTKSSLKASGKVQRSVSNSSFNRTTSLIESMYKKNSKNKLY